MGLEGEVRKLAGDWIWDGGRPSVDFLNTLRDRKIKPRETLPSPADLAEWLDHAGLAEDAQANEEDLRVALELRDAIDAAAFAARAKQPPPHTALDLINELAVAVPLVPQLVVRDRAPYAVDDRSIRAGLTRLAVDAIGLLTGDEIVRLRVCAADDCGVRFIDRSPARNRQWCSMRRCGNRTKARRHYARRT